MRKFLLICLTALCSLVTQGLWAQNTDTFTWPFDDGGTTVTATSSVSGALASSTVAFGEDTFLSFDGYDTITCDSVTSAMYGQTMTFTKINLPSDNGDFSDNERDRIDFILSLNDGYSFTPTKVSFYAVRYGTDGGQIDSYWFSSETDSILIKDEFKPARNSTTTYVIEEGDTIDSYVHTDFSFFEESITSASGCTGTCWLRLFIHGTNASKLNNKDYGLAQITITGTVTTPAGEQFDITFTPASGTVTDFGPSIAISNDGATLSMIQGQSDGPYYVIKDNESNAAACFIESDHIMMYDVPNESTQTTISEPGTYTLTIPEGILTDGTNTNAESTVTYTIEGSSTSGVEAGTTFIYESIAYTVNDDLTTVSVACQANYIDVGATGATGECKIPETVYDESNNSFTVTELATQAFYGYGNTATGNNKNNTLTESIDLPASMKAFGSQALNGIQSQITYIVCRAVEPPTASSSTVFSTTTNNAALYVPCGSADAYAAASGYGNFTSNKGIHEFGCEDGESHFTLEIETRGEISTDGSTITIITEPAAVSVTEDSGLSISILNGSDVEVATATIVEGDQEGFWTLTINPAITESGTYTISIPEGYFTKDDELSSGASAEFSFLAATDYYDVTFTPADNAEVVSISEIELSNTETGFTFNCDDDDLSNITLSNGTTNVATVTSAEKNAFAMGSSLYRSVILTLNQEITEDGTYILTIPAGIISENETTVTYIVDLFEITVGEATVASDDESLTVSITVPTGATVAAEPGVIEITKKHYTEVVAYGVLTQEGGVWTLSFVDANGDPVALEGDDDDQGTTYVATIPQGYFVSGEEKSAETTIEFAVKGTTEPTSDTFSFTSVEAKASEDGTTVTLTVEPDVMQVTDSGLEITITKEDDDEFSVAVTEVAGSAESWTLTLEEALTESGTYTVNIPAGYFQTEALATNESASAEFEFTATEEGFALTFNPDPAESVTELSIIQVSSDEITSEDGNLNITAGEDNVNVTNIAGDVVAVAYWDNISQEIGYAFELRDPTNTATAITLSEPDTYTLNIPGGFFHTGITNKSSKETEVSYTIAPIVETFDIEISDPVVAENEVTVTITSEETISIAEDAGQITITKEDDEEFIAYGRVDGQNDDGTLTIYYVTESGAPVNITDEGKYTVTIPQGFFTNADETAVNAEASVEFEIKAETPSTGGDTFVFDPADGSTVDSLSKISVTNGDNGLNPVYTGEAPITVTNVETGDVVATVPVDGVQEIFPEGDESGLDIEVIFTFDTEITDEGTYTVTIPAGILYYGTGTGVSDVSNGEITLTYTIAGKTFTITPAEGEVGVLESIELTYDGGAIKMDGSVVDTYLVDEEGNNVAGVEALSGDAIYAEDGTTVIGYTFGFINLETGENITFSTPGTYTITIPAGAFLLGEDETPSPRVTITYTIVEPSASIDLLDEVEEGVYAITKSYDELMAIDGFSGDGTACYATYDTGTILYDDDNITVAVATDQTYVANNGYQLGDIQAKYPEYTAFINMGSKLASIDETTKIEDPSAVAYAWQGMLKVTPKADGGLTYNVHAGGNIRTYGIYDVEAEDWVTIEHEVTGDVVVYGLVEQGKEYLLVGTADNSNLYQIAFPADEPEVTEPEPEVEDEVIYTTDFTDWTELDLADSNGVEITAETTTGEEFTFTLWGVSVNPGDVSQWNTDSETGEKTTPKFEGEGALIFGKYDSDYSTCEPYVLTSTISSVTKIVFTEAVTGSNRGVKISVKGDDDNDWVVVYSTSINSGATEVEVEVNRTNCQIKIESIALNQNTYILDFTVYGVVPAEEEALYATDFTDWETIDRTEANGDEVTVATTTGGNLTFTLWGVGVDPTKTDESKFPDYVGAMITAKYAEDGSAEYSVYEPFAVTSTLGTVDKVVFTQVATGSNRGIKVSVKGDDDEDWVVLHDETIHNAKGETIELDVNRTNCRIKFESFALAQNGYIADLKIYGTDATSEAEDPDKQLYEDIKIDVDALGVDLTYAWANINLEYPESVEGLQSTYDAISVEITNLQLVVEASHDGEELTTDKASIEAQVAIIKAEIDALTAAATSINSITIDNNFEGKSIYTISGQKVSAPTKAGIYIIDGKKVVIK